MTTRKSKPEALDETTVDREGLAISAGVKTIGGLIAWLSGSVAGLGAIFYAFGYLVTLGNLNMLGLDLIPISYDATFYIERGGSFLLVSLAHALEILPRWIILGAVVVITSRAINSSQGLNLSARPPFRQLLQHRELVRRITYGILLLVLICLVRSQHVLSPLGSSVSGVLFELKNSNTADSAAIRKLIISGAAGQLHEEFILQVATQVRLAVLLLIGWILATGWRYRTLLTAPFAIVFSISLIWLPLVYGKIELPTKFPEVTITLEHPTGQPAMLYLLQKTDTEFVLWNSREHRVVWIPTRLIATAEIAEGQPLQRVLQASTDRVP